MTLKAITEMAKYWGCMMTQKPDQPPNAPAKDAKGRFLPGHKFARGRPKGSPNQFGPGFRDRLMAGITRAGTKKAKKAGVNHKVDGLEYYLEHLADTNAAATASIISKLIPPEQPPPELSGSPTMININPVVSGNMWAPGQTVLLPYEECGEAWAAYRSGAEAWQAYLEEIKPQLMVEAFENLSRVVPPEFDPESDYSNLDPNPDPEPEPDNVVNLHDRTDTHKNDPDAVA